MWWLPQTHLFSKTAWITWNGLSMPAFFGAQPGPVGPDIELRVLDAPAQAAQTGKTVVV